MTNHLSTRVLMCKLLSTLNTLVGIFDVVIVVASYLTKPGILSRNMIFSCVFFVTKPNQSVSTLWQDKTENWTWRHVKFQHICCLQKMHIVNIFSVDWVKRISVFSRFLFFLVLMSLHIITLVSIYDFNYFCLAVKYPEPEAGSEIRDDLSHVAEAPLSKTLNHHRLLTCVLI